MYLPQIRQKFGNSLHCLWQVSPGGTDGMKTSALIFLTILSLRDMLRVECITSRCTGINGWICLRQISQHTTGLSKCFIELAEQLAQVYQQMCFFVVTSRAVVFPLGNREVIVG